MKTQESHSLFDPIAIGALRLPNRIIMAPLTRNRANPADDAPHALNATYYAQRATAGLIVSEASQVSLQGKGYAFTPGIYSDAQVAGWKLVTDAVHAAGGRIVLQLWHVGRISHPSLQPDGALPVAPSALPFVSQVFDGKAFVDCVVPRALEASELPAIVADFVRGAKNAMTAGFDGVEIHSANGYLLDQFLRDGANARTDSYGGSIANRVRFPLEVARAVAAEVGADRVGIRISPVTPFGDLADSTPHETFAHFVDELAKLRLAYLHVIEGSTGGDRAVPGVDYADLRARFSGAYIVNNGYDRTLAIDAVATGRVDAVAFGRPFIANPDLVERLRDDAELSAPDQATFYGGAEKGYTDYPTRATSAV